MGHRRLGASPSIRRGDVLASLPLATTPSERRYISDNIVEYARDRAKRAARSGGETKADAKGAGKCSSAKKN
jgi:hypothetical protein